MTEVITNQELIEAFDQLAIVVNLKEKKDKRKRQNTAVNRQKQELKLLLIFEASTIALSVVWALLNNLKNSLSTWNILPLDLIRRDLIYVIAFVYGLSFLILIYIFWKNFRESTQKYIQRIGEDAVVTQQAVIEFRKRIEAKPQLLESIKLHIQSSIEEIQDREKSFDSFSPILALLLIALGTYILSIHTQDLKTPYLPGGGAVVLLLLQFLYKSSSRSQVMKLKKCLSLLEQVQVLASDPEIKNVAQSKNIAALGQQLDDPAFPDITYRRGASDQPLPILRQTGLRVQTVVIASQHWGLSPNQIAAEYGLTEAQVNNALAFYAAHTSEIETAIVVEQTLEAVNV